ncbi:DUF3187 family protein [Kaarinaea lacus]
MSNFRASLSAGIFCRQKCVAISLVYLILQVPSVVAQQIHPLSITNTSPVILVHGLPNSRNPAITAKDTVVFGLDYEITSHFTHEDSTNEQLLFDGETTRAMLSLKTGLSDGVEVELQIPHISHDGGFLDSFIIDWHNFFGLPQNGRDQVPNNQLEYYYAKNGVDKLGFQEPASGVGDSQIIFAFKSDRKWLPHQKNLTFKTALKLPTGDSAKLTGSGAYAISAWLTGDMQTNWFSKKGLTYLNLGAMWLPEGEVLTDQQNFWVWFGGIGSGIKFGERIVLQLQLDTHSPFYHSSDFVELNSYALQLTIGGNLKFSKNWNLDIGVVEDLIVHASPDVIFHFRLNGRW